MEIDLKTKPETIGSAEKYDPKAPYYPSIHLSGIGDVGIEDGSEVTVTGIVKNVTKTSRNGKTTYSCEIEAHSMECDECDEGGDDGIDNAMRKIEKKKAKDAQDEGDQAEEDSETTDNSEEEADEG